MKSKCSALFFPTEVCPFCGKTYKRLKSHLPYCKAAASSKTPPTHHDVTVKQTSSSRPAAALTESTTKEGKLAHTLSATARPQSKKSTKRPSVSSAPPQSSVTAPPLKSEHTSSSSQSLSPSSAPLPLSARKKKQKLSEQIKAAAVPSSPSALHITTQSAPLMVANSKPKKKSVRALIEAAKSQQDSKGSSEGTRSASEDRASGSTPFVADPQSTRTTAKTEAKINRGKGHTHPAFLSIDSKPKGASKPKVSKSKKATQPLPTNKDSSITLNSEVNESSATPCVRGNVFVNNGREVKGLSVNHVSLKSGSGHQARITLQDVKATLGRANTSHPSGRSSILGQIASADLSSKIRPVAGLSLAPHLAGHHGDQLPGTSSQHAALKPVWTKSSTSQQSSLIPLQHDGSPQSGLNSSTAPLPPGRLSSQVSQAMNKGLKLDHPRTGLPTGSLFPQISTPYPIPPAPQSLLARVETLRADPRATTENGTKGQYLTLVSTQYPAIEKACIDLSDHQFFMDSRCSVTAESWTSETEGVTRVAGR